MTLTLVTVLYNSAPALPRFLADLRAQTMADWRLIAVDNASRDGAAELLEASEDARILLLRNGRNEGFARAVNRGLRHAARDPAASRFLVINNDVTFDPGFLGQLLAAWDRSCGPVVAPRIMRLEDPDHAWYAGGHLETGGLMMNVHEPFDPTDTRPHRPVTFASGCCLGLRREVLEQAGLLDESFFVYWEDTDFSMRLNALGVPMLYLRDPFLLHEGGAASGGEFSRAYNRLYYESQMVLLRKHRGFLHAVRSAWWLLRLEARRPAPRLKPLGTLAFALLRGLARPLRPVPRLDPDGRPEIPAPSGAGS